MLTSNQTTHRCLVLSKNVHVVQMLKNLLEEMNFQTDFVNDRKCALKYFLQYKHYLLCMDAEFLPRFPFRLVQLFKIAHRTPGVVIFNAGKKNLAGFERLEGYHRVRVLEDPFISGTVHAALVSILDATKKAVQAVFIKNLLVQIGIALPLFTALVVYLLVKGGVVH